MQRVWITGRTQQTAVILIRQTDAETITNILKLEPHLPEKLVTNEQQTRGFHQRLRFYIL